MSLYYRQNGQPFDTPFTIEYGIDGSKYAVFNNEFEAEDFAEDVLQRGDAIITCFGGFMNAVCLDNIEIPTMKENQYDH